MTICLAIKCIETVQKEAVPSILFAADTQASSTLIKSSATKLRILFGKEPEEGKTWNMVAASSGDAAVIDEVVEKIDYLLWGKIKPEHETPSIQLRVFRSEIGDVAYDIYKKYRDRDLEDTRFELLLGAADQHSTILRVTCEGKTQVLERYGVIGTGKVTGGELLLTELLDQELDENQAASLAALVISIVGHVDMFVGGEPDIYKCRERRAWGWKEDAYRRILKESESRWSLMKGIWVKMQEDDKLKNKLSKLLESKNT